MALPLEGIKIVDFGIYLAGPFAGRLLGDLGAEVIKIETPEGEVPRPRNGNFVSNMLITYSNRGRNISVDLKEPEGLRIAQQLIAEADIVSQNLRVGVAERLGIGYEDCLKLNPQIIYLASTGYGTRGPRAHHPSFEPLNSAFVGQHYRSGGAGNPPIGSISLDAFCGLIAANGLLMALIHRRQTGEAQYLDVSQLACGMYFTSDTFRFADGTLGPLPQLDSEQRGLSALDRLYRTSDGWICIYAEEDHQWAALCAGLDRPGLEEDERFRTSEDRRANDEVLGAVLDDAFATRTAGEWSERLGEHGVPCEVPAAGGLAALQDPASLASGLMIEYQHAEWGRVVEPRVIPTLSETPGRAVTKSPLLGEHTREILTELHYSEAEIEELLRRGIVSVGHREVAAVS